MINLTIAGNIGKDAETRTHNGNKFTSFSVCASKGKDKDEWFDCTIFGDRGENVAPYIKKGGKITCSGDVSARAHDGKAYLSCFVDKFTLQGGKADSGASGGGQQQSQQQPAPSDYDDGIPF